MSSVLLRACALILVIILGITFRQTGFIPDNAGDTVKKLLIYGTLPCAIVTNMSKMESVSGALVFLLIFGIIANVIMIVLGAVLTRKRGREAAILLMFSLPAFNIGSFGLPFVQSFLPAAGIAAVSAFDVGNSIMCVGGTYAIVSEYTSEEKHGFHPLSILKKLVTSPPLVAYVGMFLLKTANVSIPDPVLRLIEPAASANPFIAMMMIGLLFHLEFRKDYLGDIFQMLALRHVFSILASLLVWFVFPIDPVMKKALIVVLFAPMSVVAPAYTGMCGGDEGKASAANSLSILCGVIEITILLLFMGTAG